MLRCKGGSGTKGRRCRSGQASRCAALRHPNNPTLTSCSCLALHCHQCQSGTAARQPPSHTPPPSLLSFPSAHTHLLLLLGLEPRPLRLVHLLPVLREWKRRGGLRAEEKHSYLVVQFPLLIQLSTRFPLPQGFAGTWTPPSAAPPPPPASCCCAAASAPPAASDTAPLSLRGHEATGTGSSDMQRHSAPHPAPSSAHQLTQLIFRLLLLVLAAKAEERRHADRRRRHGGAPAGGDRRAAAGGRPAAGSGRGLGEVRERLSVSSA